MICLCVPFYCCCYVYLFTFVYLCFVLSNPFVWKFFNFCGFHRPFFFRFTTHFFLSSSSYHFGVRMCESITHQIILYFRTMDIYMVIAIVFILYIFNRWMYCYFSFLCFFFGFYTFILDPFSMHFYMPTTFCFVILLFFRGNSFFWLFNAVKSHFVNLAMGRQQQRQQMLFRSFRHL